MNLKDLEQMRNHSINNRNEIEKSESCGCYHCKKIFVSSEVKEWLKDKNGETARCPYCSIDSVIGDASGYLITEEFLNKMNEKWFK